MAAEQVLDERVVGAAENGPMRACPSRLAQQRLDALGNEGVEFTVRCPALDRPGEIGTGLL